MILAILNKSLKKDKFETFGKEGKRESFYQNICDKGLFYRDCGLSPVFELSPRGDGRPK